MKMVGEKKKLSQVLLKRIGLVFLPLFLAIGGVWLPSQFIPQVLASSECNVDVLSPENPPVNNDVGFDFYVSDSIKDFQWAEIIAPSDQLMLYDGFSPDLVGSNVTSSQAIFNNGDVPAGSDTDLHIDVQVGNYFPPTNWTVEVSSDPNGANPVTCGGTTDIAPSDTTPPNISSITATVVNNAATISWQTDKLADSQVFYGTTINYGLQQVDSSYVTSHSIKLPGLSPNTTYHYQISSTDQAGNVTVSSDNTFTTPATQSSSGGGSNNNGNNSNSNGNNTISGNSNVSPVTTSAPTSVLEPTVTIPTDTTPPTAQLNTKLQNPYKTIPVFSGTASDKIAVARVEYSTDDGKDWLPVDNVTGINSPSASFSFTPVNLSDGTYQVMVRATNAGGKVAVSAPETLVIVHIPPGVGGDVFSIGTQILDPDSNGTISLPANINVKISLDTVGGPTKVKVVAKNLSNPRLKPLQFSLLYNSYNTLWQGNLKIKQSGNYVFESQAVNGVNEEVDRQLNSVNVEKSGQITDADSHKPINAEVTVHYRDPITQAWTLWAGSAYNQDNPYEVSGSDGYSFLLPAGTYYLNVSAKNYHSATSKIFTLDKLTNIADNFSLSKEIGLHIGSFGFNLSPPDFNTVPVTIGSRLSSKLKPALALNKDLPNFSLPLTNGHTLGNVNLLGQPTILTVITTWAPPAQDQLAILNKLNPSGLNIIPVSVGESGEALSVYNNIAGYNLPIMVDSNQQLVPALGLNSLPTTYFIDRQGTVKKVMVGVLSSSELMNNVEY